MSEITIRGRIATVHLARGETAVVEHTDTIDRLIAGGWVEAVNIPQAEPEPESTESQVANFETEDEELPVAEEAKPIHEDDDAPARRKPSRRKASS